MSCYLDTSALAKLIVVEKETRALRAWLARRAGAALVTSVVGAVELQRLAARVSQEAVSKAAMLLARIDLLEVTASIQARAATLPPPEVRTLDALHVASAHELADLEALVSYDARMAAAAAAFGLPVASPGRRR